MEMAEHELLVHIAASSRLQDDKRYIAVARAVLDFQPAIITRVSGPDPDYSWTPSSGSNFIEDGQNLPRTPLPHSTTAPLLSSGVYPDSISSVRRGHQRAHSDTCSKSDRFSVLDYSDVSISAVRGEPSNDQSKMTPRYQPRQRGNGESPTSANSGRKRTKLWTNGIHNGDMQSTQHSLTEKNDSDVPSTPRYNEQHRSDCEDLATDDADSTQFASQPQEVLDNRQVTTELKSQDPQSPVVIDLTSPERQAPCSYPTPTSRPGHIDYFRSATAPAVARQRLSVSSKNKVRQRPDEVWPLRKSLPQGTQPSFTTHITTDLDRFTPQLKHFRPAFVARDVKVLERGYWRFWVKIIEPEGPPKPTLKILGSTARRRRHSPDVLPIEHGLWTQEAFVTVWENVARVIELGKTGWGTRLDKDSTDDILWRVRVFTWGETFAHVWLLLCNLSNKLTGVIVTEWVAANGQVIVQMMPGKNLKGTWQRKGPHGAQGVLTFS